MDSRDPEEEGSWPHPNHFPNKLSPSVFVSEDYFGLSVLHQRLRCDIQRRRRVLTDRPCVLSSLSLCRTTCLRHHRSRGSWTPAATTRTCTRPRRKATPASITMTTTWCPGPWSPSFTTWSQLLTIIQMWVLVLLHFIYFLSLVLLCFCSFTEALRPR